MGGGQLTRLTVFRWKRLDEKFSQLVSVRCKGDIWVGGLV